MTESAPQRRDQVDDIDKAILNAARSEPQQRRIAYLLEVRTFSQTIGEPSETAANPARAIEHLKAEVLFDLEWDGRVHRGLICGVKQTAGSGYEQDMLEVIPPDPMPEKVPYDKLRDCIEGFYREAVGS